MPTWDHIFREQPGRLGQSPAEAARALAEEVRLRGGQRILDLGCGTGRNLLHLLREGFEVCGTDVSKTGLALCRERLEEEGLTADLGLADMTAQPYRDDSFDGVLSTSVLHHNTRRNMQRALAEIARVLRPGGVSAITVNSTSDGKRGLGPEVEPNTFVVEEGLEAGVVHHFADEHDVRDLLASFRLMELREERVTHYVARGSEEGPSVSGHWFCLFEKP